MKVSIRGYVLFTCVMLLNLRAADGQTRLSALTDRWKASLAVSSNVNGASVYLDSVFLGITPLERNDLTPGVYRLRVLHPNRHSWYRESIEETIELKPERRNEYDARFEYVYRVHSIPYGARIFHDNAFRGITPAVLREPQRLAGSLLLKKEGYEEATFELNRWNGEVIELPLTPLRGFGGPGTFLDVESPQIRHKTPILISGIVGIVSGVAAVYFKQQADDSFSAFQRTQDPKLLSRTDRYDRISGLSLVAFEISLASLTYLLLSQ